MANARFQVSVQDRGLKGLFDRVARLAGRKLRNNFADLRPLVKDSIDDSITKKRNTFIPSANEVGQLGVGVGGAPDSRARTAWRALLPGNGDVTTFSVRKKGTERGSTIGEIRLSINEEAFYQAPESNIDIDSDILQTIPWMRWLINGETINQYTFTEGDPAGVSRTGRGIMVGGGMWTFVGRGKEVYGRILNDARLSINRKLKSNEGVSILRRLR